MAMLELHDVHTFYGSIEALKGISLTVEEGEVVALLGGNGAGKSTTLRTISGLLRPRQGDVRFGGRSIVGRPPEEIVKLGIVQVPEGRRIFGPLTVEENLEMGAFLARGQKARIQEDMARVYDMFPRLRERRHQLAGTLSGGEQQMLAVGRALMARPRLLMLDEPSMGLAPNLVQFIMQTVREINRQGVTVLVVEQNARSALRLATRAYVIETGSVTLEGPANELARNDQVVAAYLGGRR
ncbi:branched-chain amino acid transport system ATP-binding protein [Symbiobacterium terraclitae]|uniref:Branched-chain amino acid transport system ATP-binding protein n=2 Tax=Symbiobacterium terraclitae TaxID=557451 RepID=A0ABS4JPN6_9FIRM|nr:ABC transporter ATP-binding protein [Symbiobacterium terraclitae]MBP2017482.1 branched-chain amino acid transport system ATP-binding protein [Symbiobacterium terraclitae]